MPLLLSSPKLGSGRRKLSSKGRKTPFQGVQQNSKWPLVMIGLSILLALIGSVDVGHAFFTNRVGTSVHKNTSISKATSNPKISPTPTKTPIATPTPTEIPVATPMPALQPKPSPSPTDANIVVQDTFNRPDQASWGSTSDGLAWQGDASSAYVFSIHQGKGVVANGGSYYSAVIGSDVSAAMILTSGKIVNDGKMDDGGNTSIGGLLRWKDKDNWYKAYFDRKVLGIKRVKNGKTVILATLPFVAQPDTAYTLRFRAKGSALCASVWETDMPEPQQWMLTVNDDALSSGLGGLRLGIGKSAPIYITSFTEFSV
jgi:hypothetical protein